MSSAPAVPAGDWPVLSLHERRVLGVLIEKQKTTPDVYPLSINALVTGSNQKSNRDPVLDLTDDDVEQSLLAMQKQGLTIRITGGRVERWRHNLYDVWKVDKVEMAVLAELMLRGPQTEGELRGRVSRMEPVNDLDVLRTLLKRLTERRLVVYLTEEGRRGTMVTHGFHDAKELEHLRATQGAAESAIEPAPRQPRLNDNRLEEALAQIAALQNAMTELTARVSALERARTP